MKKWKNKGFPRNSLVGNLFVVDVSKHNTYAKE